MGQVVVQQCSQFTVSLFSGNVEGSTEYRAQRARVATSTACALSRQSQNTFFSTFLFEGEDVECGPPTSSFLPPVECFKSRKQKGNYKKAQKKRNKARESNN